ncbi:MAG TPA: copper transporter [Sporichthya sp.]|nr:copper transporter [Sporichthya sp.]
MVSFRYHLVSLIAVFMALAVGILVGSSLLNQSVLDSQRATIKAQSAEKDNLRRDLDTVRNEVLYRDQYLVNLDDRLLAGQLAGQRVVLVTMPGAAGGDADGLTDMLTRAGARVTGRIGVQDGFFATAEDPREVAAKAQSRDEILAKNFIPELRGQPAQVQLAGALLTRGGADRAVSAPARKLLDQLDRGGFISRSRLEDRADLAVLLVGAPPDPAVSAATNRTDKGMVALAAALDAAGNGVVVAAPTKAAVGGAMDAIRKADSTRDAISTVDTIETVFGRVAAVYALVEQLGGGAGHYGSTSGSDAPIPPAKLAPGKR